MAEQETPSRKELAERLRRAFLNVAKCMEAWARAIEKEEQDSGEDEPKQGAGAGNNC